VRLTPLLLLGLSCRSAVLQERHVPPSLWPRILAEPARTPVPQGTAGMVLPHEVRAAPDLAASYRAWAAVADPQLVLLISPNHFERGQAPIQSFDGAYRCHDGQLLLSTERLARRLQRQGLVSLEEVSFAEEHGIATHVEYLHHFWPQARILPLILKAEIDPGLLAMLAAALQEQLDPANTVVVASVDFSHYLPQAAAHFHDQRAWAALRNFDRPGFAGLEADSSLPLDLLAQLMEARGCQRATLLQHGNSQQRFPDRALERTISYLHVAFSPGQRQPLAQVSLQFFGDAIFDRGVLPDLVINPEPEVHCPARAKARHYQLLAGLEGPEKRFFMGTDLNLLNLEGPIAASSPAADKGVVFNHAPAALDLLAQYGFGAVNLANNHILDHGRQGAEHTRQLLRERGIVPFGDYASDRESCALVQRYGLRIALCGFNDVGQVMSLALAGEQLRRWRQRADFLLVNMHWGQEYAAFPDARQEQVGAFLAEQGADLVIGHHPHVVQPLEFRDGCPIFHSLGNFVFDQHEPPETGVGLSVGVVLEKLPERRSMSFHLFPFHTGGGQPHAFTVEERESFLAYYLQSCEEWRVHGPVDLRVE